MSDLDRITPETGEKPKKKKKGPNRLLRLIGRLLALVVTVLLIVGAVYLVVNRDKISIDSIRRTIAYRTASGETAEQYAYEGDLTGSFACLESGLLFCGTRSLQLYSGAGELVLEEQIEFDQPVLCVQGDYALVYDAGGTQLYVIHQEQIVHTYSTSGDHALLSVRIDENGWLTIVEEASGYKAAVTVYNASYQPVLTENISSSFITDAILSYDHKELALVSIGEDSAGFTSELIFYSLSDGEETDRCALGDEVVLDLDWEKNALWVAGEYGGYAIVDGDVVAEYTEPTRYLQQLSLGGDDFAALFFSRYQTGSSGTLNVLQADGTIHAVSLNEEVLSVSAAGDYLAVLTASGLTVYRSDLTEYAETDNSWSARRVLMRSDGSALLISGESVHLYLPD